MSRPATKTIGTIPRHLLLLLLHLALAGCASVVERIASVADLDVSPIVDLFKTKEPEISAEQTARLKLVAVARPLWQSSIIDENRVAVFSPAFANGAVYAANSEGRLVRLDSATGKQAWNIDTQHKLSGGVGVGEGMMLVGTFKGEVLAFDDTGKSLWKAQVSSEVLGPPQVDSGVIVVRTGDGRIFGLDAVTGKRKWMYQGATPALTVRNPSRVLIKRGAAFAGFAGGKLVALSLSDGNVKWEATVSRPRGATELERITDITSLPVADEWQICAVAYQGRVACFEISNGNQIWARDASSSAGLAMDDTYIYLSEDRGALTAYTKSNGTTVWRQDILGGLRLTVPIVRGTHVVVGDSQGYVNFFRHDDGAIVLRAATDESSILADPESLANGIVVQTRKGGLYAFSIQ
ncbi:MAG: outer membrane protein assembly factor BamB [Nitrosomonadaceae bacterium]|nr:outer membrane protein assembly factor BamB [Nitrosomonadaceae bacterium]